MRLREAVLGAIREEQGQWVSGERLSMSLKVSRTTIWKQIKILQSEGYAIESSPKKGYRLSMIPDILSPEEVKDGPAKPIKAPGSASIISAREAKLAETPPVVGLVIMLI
jgi:biotin operon repressor BirA-like protein